MKSSVHVLFVAWQDPESRRIFPIARLSRRVSGRYEFGYVRAVHEAQAHGFLALPGLEELNRVYQSEQLPELFERGAAVRRGRSQPPGLAAAQAPPGAAPALDAAPISVFVRRPNQSAPERLEVFAPPLLGEDGKYWGIFEARGVGRVQGSEAVLAGLSTGQQLALSAEPDNVYNPAAVRIELADGRALGYVPDYFANELAAAGGRLAEVSVEVARAERVTFAPAPAVYRVACRYRCSAELGRQLFASARYDLIARPRPLV
jgi:hypothetical protein